MLTRRRLTMLFLGLCVVLFVGSLVKSIFFKEHSTNISQKPTADIFKEDDPVDVKDPADVKDPVADEDIDAKADNAEYRHIDEATGLVDWQVEGESIKQLKDDNFVFSGATMTLFPAAGKDAKRSEMKITAPTVLISDGIGELKGGLEISSAGVHMSLDRATIDLQERLISSDEELKILQHDPVTSKPVLQIEGRGLQGSTDLQAFKVLKVKQVTLFANKGDLFNSDPTLNLPITINCAGVLSVASQTGEIVFNEAVAVRQGESFLTCNRLVFKFDPASGSLQSAQAKGAVVFRSESPRGVVTGKTESMRYDASHAAKHPFTGELTEFSNVLQLTGPASHVQIANDTIQADNMTIYHGQWLVVATGTVELNMAERKTVDEQWFAGLGVWTSRCDNLALDYAGDGRASLQQLILAGQLTVKNDKYFLQGDKLLWDVNSAVGFVSGQPAVLRNDALDQHMQAHKISYDGRKSTLQADVNVQANFASAMGFGGVQDDSAPRWQLSCDQAFVLSKKDSLTNKTMVASVELLGNVKLANLESSGTCGRIYWMAEGGTFVAEAVAGERLHSVHGDYELWAQRIHRRSENHIELSGDVEIHAPATGDRLQNLRVNAGQMDVFFEPKEQRLLKLVSSGGTTFKYGDVEGSGDNVSWNQDAETILLKGAPASIWRGDDLLTADKLAFYSRNQTAIGSGNVKMLFLSEEDVGLAGTGKRWTLTADDFQLEFADAGSERAVKSAELKGNVRLLNGSVDLRGRLFEWDGLRARGVLHGSPKVQLMMDGVLMEGDSVAFSPYRKGGGKNHLQIIRARTVSTADK